MLGDTPYSLEYTLYRFPDEEDEELLPFPAEVALGGGGGADGGGPNGGGPDGGGATGGGANGGSANGGGSNGSTAPVG